MSHTWNSLVVLLAFSTLPAAGAGQPSPSKTEPFTIDGKSIEFVTVPEKHLMISKNCERKPGKFDCAAFRSLALLKKAKSKDAESGGGAHPGAALCKVPLRGVPVIGMDPDGNENGFCRFSDGSLIDQGTLFRYAFDQALSATSKAP